VCEYSTSILPAVVGDLIPSAHMHLRPHGNHKQSQCPLDATHGLTPTPLSGSVPGLVSINDRPPTGRVNDSLDLPATRHAPSYLQTSTGLTTESSPDIHWTHHRVISRHPLNSPQSSPDIHWTHHESFPDIQSTHHRVISRHLLDSPQSISTHPLDLSPDMHWTHHRVISRLPLDSPPSHLQASTRLTTSQLRNEPSR